VLFIELTFVARITKPSSSRSLYAATSEKCSTFRILGNPDVPFFQHVPAIMHWVYSSIQLHGKPLGYALLMVLLSRPQTGTAAAQ
jgi:hypothetical protein